MTVDQPGLTGGGYGLAAYVGRNCARARIQPSLRVLGARLVGSSPALPDPPSVLGTHAVVLAEEGAGRAHRHHGETTLRSRVCPTWRLVTGDFGDGSDGTPSDVTA
jgi:hypothetical protein